MKKKLIHGLLTGLGAGAIALCLWSAGALDRWELTTWAWRVQAFAKPGPATDKIKLILLDQNSIDWGEKENGLSWPWPREVYSLIIDFCKRSGARALIFDVLYTEPSLYGSGDDQTLGAAIDRAPPFVVPLFLSNQSGAATEWPAEISHRLELRIDNLDVMKDSALAGGVVMQRAVFPVEEIANRAGILASATDESDLDGIFRRAHLFRVFDGRPVPSLGLGGFIAGDEGFLNAMASAANGSFPLKHTYRMSLDGGLVCAGERKIPIDREGRMLLRYRGPAGAFDSFSAASVIQSELRIRAGEKPTIENPDVFKDCYVFFGFSAPGLLDLRPTPIGKITPGVEIYATMLDNLLAGDFLRDAPRAPAILSTILFAVLSSLLVVLLSRKAWHSALVFFSLLPLPVISGFAAYPLGYWWPMTLQGSAVGLALVGAILVNYATEGRQKTFIKKAFRHYLSPLVIERILEDPSQLKLGGERRELTIFFSDLQGFSSISEKLDPEVLTSLLNDYLSDMTDIILEEGGTLDKYEGDAIIAFWNAPLTLPDHAERACRAAVRCQMRLQERREEFRQRSGFELRARIGLNTGEVVVGNMGSHKRFDYTVLGDAANLASRLEGANKPFGTYIMVSEETWSRTSGKFAGREMGLLRVIGRKTPVRIFELISLPGEVKSPQLERFELGLSLCYAKEWRKALEIFEELPEDPVAQAYARRCRSLAQESDADWDCIWSQSEK